MKLLVCGGAGFIGSNFIHFVINNYSDIKVLNYDKLTYAGNLDNLRDLEKNPRYSFFRGDIADKPTFETKVKEFEPDVIINFAGETHNDHSVHGDTMPFVMTDVVGVNVILNTVRLFKIKKFIHVSTDEVYGETEIDDTYRFKEADPFRPNSPYAAAKAGGDLMCRAYWESFKTPVIVTHCTNNYGPYQFPEKLIPFFTFRAIHNKPLPLYGDGMNVRDWIYVLDHCEALMALVFKANPGKWYNIASQNHQHNIDIAKKILKILGKPESLITFVEDRPGHDRRYALDTTAIEKDLNWKPRHTDFEKALAETISWYNKNMDWVKRLEQKIGRFNPHIKI